MLHLISVNQKLVTTALIGGLGYGIYQWFASYKTLLSPNDLFKTLPHDLLAPIFCHLKYSDFRRLLCTAKYFSSPDILINLLDLTNAKIGPVIRKLPFPALLATYKKVYAYHVVTIYDHPDVITPSENIVDVASCAGAAFLVTTTGQLYLTGYQVLASDLFVKQNDKLWVLPKHTNILSVAADYNGDHFGFVTVEGKIHSNSLYYDQVISNIPDIKMIVCGEAHLVILTNQGNLYTCGSNVYGQLGTGDNVYHTSPVQIVVENKIISRISCGNNHTALITSDGQLYTFGRNNRNQLGIDSTLEYCRVPTQVDTLNGKVIQVICCCDRIGFLTEDGSIFLMGNGNHTQWYVCKGMHIASTYDYIFFTTSENALYKIHWEAKKVEFVDRETRAIKKLIGGGDFHLVILS